MRSGHFFAKINLSMTRRQAGFGVTGILIVLVIIAVVAGAAFAVSRRNSATSVPDPAPTPTAKEQATPASSSAKKQPNEADRDLKTIVIKEWGIVGSVQTKQSLKYKVYETNSNLIVFDSAELAAADAMCANNAGGSIGRLKPDELVYPELIATYTAEQFATDPLYKDGAKLIKKVGDYYYYFYGRQGPCGPTGAELQTETQNIVKDLLQSFQPAAN
jgi:hypothetical protein